MPKTTISPSTMIPGDPDWIESYPGGRRAAMAELRRVGACKYLKPYSRDRQAPDWIINHRDGRKEGIWTGNERVYPYLPENRPYIFPLMPAEASNRKERHFFFGWATTQEELKTFRWSRKRGEVRFSICPPIDGIRCLRRRSGFEDLRQVRVENPNKRKLNTNEEMEEFEVESLVTEEWASTSRLREWESTICIMLWVNSAELAHPIPTRGQVEKLVEVFGRQPKWYRDIYERRDFHEHGLFIMQSL